MANQHAIITGSLDKDNIGDLALLKVFLNCTGNKYQNLTVIGATNQQLLPAEYNIVSPPPMAIGFRFWKGYKERRKARNMILEEIPDARRHYVWLGGLFGPNVYHSRFRNKELNWASTFCDTLLYYFGDVEPGFNSSSEARRLIQTIDGFNTWISVRSAEAAHLLVDAGLRSKIYIGIDPVLYDRCKHLGIPFIRQKKDSTALGIVVCNFQQEKYVPIWLAAALFGIKLGMKILWISLCDSEDMDLCKQLFKFLSEQYPTHPMEIISGLNGESKIAEASVCVATRFHGAIFSLTAGVPTIAVPYGAKVKRLFKFMNLENWIADPAERSQRDANWNTILSEKVTDALQGKWQPDYTLLKAGIKAHDEALAALDSILL